MLSTTFVIVTCLFWLGLIAQLVAAGVNGTLTYGQLRARRTHPQQEVRYLALAWHGAMWGNVFLAPLLGYIVSTYAHQWSGTQVLAADVVAVAASIGLQVMWAETRTPEAHGHDGKIHAPGYVQIVFLSQALAILLLFLACTHDVSPRTIRAVVLLLWVYLILASHVIASIFAPPDFPKEVADNGAVVIIGGGFGLVLAGLFMYIMQ